MVADEDCHAAGGMPPAGEQVTLEVKVADPGTEEVLILPDAGLPIAVAATGSPSVGPAESMRSYAARTEWAGALVSEGKHLTVDLDTSVLFNIDEATLTSNAEGALDAAAQALQSQDSRGLLIAGHTDSVGSEEDNMKLSEQRAKAVAEALDEKLGPGWEISIEWHGESKPAAKESGSEAEVDAARARNRRVEVTVQ